MDEPIWLDRLLVDAMHHDLIRVHGGMPGIKDENALESALGRPRNRWGYEPDVDLPTLAAAYGFGLATNHGYSDGNKRIAFMSMYTFLGVNGWAISAPEPEIVELMISIATHERDEIALALWLRDHIVPLEE